jgi:hypothetical protein
LDEQLQILARCVDLLLAEEQHLIVLNVKWGVTARRCLQVVFLFAPFNVKLLISFFVIQDCSHLLEQTIELGLF